MAFKNCLSVFKRCKTCSKTFIDLGDKPLCRMCAVDEGQPEIAPTSVPLPKSPLAPVSPETAATAAPSTPGEAASVADAVAAAAADAASVAASAAAASVAATDGSPTATVEPLRLQPNRTATGISHKSTSSRNRYVVHNAYSPPLPPTPGNCSPRAGAYITRRETGRLGYVVRRPTSGSQATGLGVL